MQKHTVMLDDFEEFEASTTLASCSKSGKELRVVTQLYPQEVSYAVQTTRVPLTNTTNIERKFTMQRLKQDEVRKVFLGRGANNYVTTPVYDERDTGEKFAFIRNHWHNLSWDVVRNEWKILDSYTIMLPRSLMA